jgi:hypothetical protein
MPKDLAEAFVSVDRCDPSWGRDKDDGAPFSPDFLTSAQYYRAAVVSPHHRLLLAILEDGIRCFQRSFAATNGPRRILFRETEEWLFDSEGTAFLSFPIVCESLGIDPVQLRRSLREWHLRKKAGGRATFRATEAVPAEPSSSFTRRISCADDADRVVLDDARQSSRGQPWCGNARLGCASNVRRVASTLLRVWRCACTPKG